MNLISIIGSFCLVATTMLSGITDEYLLDYARITKAYTSASDLSYSVSYKSFDTNKQRPDTVLIGKFEFKGNCFRSSLSGTESIKNEKYYLSVDHANKMVFLTNASGVAPNFLPISNIDSVLRKTNLKIQATDISSTQSKRYTISYPKGAYQFKSVSIEFDKASYFIKKVILNLYARENLYDVKNWSYLEEPFIEMVYQQYSHANIDSKRFELSSFINVKNGHDATLSSAYKNYKFVNSISISKQIH